MTKRELKKLVEDLAERVRTLESRPVQPIIVNPMPQVYGPIPELWPNRIWCGDHPWQGTAQPLALNGGCAPLTIGVQKFGYAHSGVSIQ